MGPAELPIVFILALPLLLALWGIIDILRHKFSGANDKVIWLLIVFLIPVVGFILYLLIGRKRRLGI